MGVSVDAPEKNAQFCTAEGLDFYMLSDKNGQVSKEYGSAISIPGTWRCVFQHMMCHIRV